MSASRQRSLEPDPAQRAHGWHLAQPGWGICMVDGREQPPAIMPDGPCQGGTGCVRRREPVILSPPRVTTPERRQ